MPEDGGSAPIADQKTLALVNAYLTNTASLLNTSAARYEEQLRAVHQQCVLASAAGEHRAGPAVRTVLLCCCCRTSEAERLVSILEFKVESALRSAMAADRQKGKARLPQAKRAGSQHSRQSSVEEIRTAEES